MVLFLLSNERGKGREHTGARSRCKAFLPVRVPPALADWLCLLSEPPRARREDLGMINCPVF